MENICKMEMANAIFKMPCIKTEKRFLGLKTNVVYTPTNSQVVGDCLEYDLKNGEEVKQLFATESKEIEKILVQNGFPKSTINGHVRLLLCYSMDHRFVALQIFQYENFEYHSLGEPRFEEGENARILLSAFVK